VCRSRWHGLCACAPRACRIFNAFRRGLPCRIDDVALLDIAMPQRDGQDIQRQLKPALLAVRQALL